MDSGDLAYLSKRAREMLDKAGHTEAKIFASGDIDEHIIATLNSQGAKIDVWGIGTKLITSAPRPALGGVYKLAEIQNGEGVWEPRMKFSDTPEKITNPGFKTIFRIYDEKGMAAADLIALKGESIDTTKPLTIFHPIETWKKTTFEDYGVRELHVCVFERGKQVYEVPSLKETIEFAKKSKGEFYEEHKRLVNPHSYKVDLSDKLYDLRMELMIKNHT